MFLPIGAWADSYFGINIDTRDDGIWVTDANASNILGDGTMSYDITNNILTLNGIDLSFTSDVSNTAFLALVDQDHPTITVRLVGDNTLALGNKACFFNGWGITFTTDASEPGTLTINPGDNWGGALFIYNPTSQSMNATYNNGLGLSQNGNTYTIQAPVTSYNITVAGTAVTSANASNIFGQDYATASYDNASNTLTLKGVNYGGQTSSFVSIGGSLESLTVHLVGYNQVGYDAEKLFSSTNACTVNITTDATIPGELQYYRNESDVTDNVTFNFGTSGLGLTVTTIQATSGTSDICYFGIGEFHADDPQEGYPYYVYSSPIWYFSNAAIRYGNTYNPPTVNSSAGTTGYVSRMKSSGSAIIKSLIFQYVPVSGETINVALTSLDGGTTYATGTLANGLVTLTPTTLVSYDDVCLTFTSESAFSFVPLAVKTIEPEFYDITVGGVQVTDQNASGITGNGITGTVTFTPAGDTTPATLTLTDATIIPEGEGYGIKYTGTANLTISLNGTSNVVKGAGNCNAILYDGTGADIPTLTFKNGGTDPCSLQLESVNTQTIDGFGSVVNTGLYKIDETILGADQSNIYQTTITSSILGGGTGTSSDPLLIKTKEHLAAFAQYVNSGVITTEYVELNDNINCSGITGFMPVGNSTHPFTGTFTNSDNYTISNLNCTTAGADGYIGLFGVVGSNGATSVAGSVSGLILNNCSFSGGKVGGAIAGYLSYGTINNCQVINSSVTTSSGDGPTSAGIAGESFGTITNCTVSGCTITASTTSGSNSLAAGGVAGSNGGTIRNCEVTGTTEHPTLIKSINSGTDGEPDKLAGGIVGYCINDNSLTMIISYNNVKGVTTVDCEDTGNAAQAGAIIGHCPDNINITLMNNTYEYTVKTIIKNGGDTDERTGYAQRGNGDFVYDEENQTNVYTDITADNGAVMYTQKVTFPTVTGATITKDGNYYSYDATGINIAPGQTATMIVEPSAGYAISSFTATNVDDTAISSEPLSENRTRYSFEMPDKAVTVNVTCNQVYNLWIGETQVTSANAAHILGEGNTTVTFTAANPQQANSINTLTLNGAVLTVPIKVGLDNLTIDIQGTNSITTEETCIQNMIKIEGTAPAVTFTSTTTEVGSLTLKSEAGVNDIGVDHKGSFSISDKLALVLKKSGLIYSNQYWFTDGTTTEAKLSPSYGVTVGEMQICPDNADDVIGYGIGDGNQGGMVSFDKESSTLTLTNASLSGIIRSSLPDLKIELVGNNSIYSGGDRILQAGVAVNMTIQSSAAVKGSLSMQKGYSSSEKGNFVDDNVTLAISEPLSVVSGSLTDDNVASDYYATIGVDYGLTVAGVTVSNVNASNVLGGATATVVFTPADNTASPATPATLTLNGADNLGTILSGLENLKVVINGDNAAVQVKANSAVSGNKNITFEGGTNGGTLAISAGDGGSVVSGFASVSYDGAYAAANVPFGYDKTASQQGYRKSHMMDDNSYLETLTITTVPHYPIWLYTNVTTSTQINNTNKNTLLGASGNVSFDGSNTLSLKNSVNCTARIVSGLSDLKISIDGDCIIESPDSGSVVRSINSSAPLTIEKASGASSASLKLAAVSFTAIKAFASLDYTGLILLSEGATYSSGALNGSKGEPLNVANFTTGLKKPTIQMNYENDTYSFNNPNEGGTLKYSRYFANNESPDEENQIDNGTTTFQIFKNGRQYNDPLTVICEVWVEANGNSSDKLYACRLDVKDMIATYGGTVPAPEFLPKAIEGVTISGYSLGDHTQVAATVTEGNITLTGAGRQELDVIFNIPNGVEYIKTSTTETPQASFFLDVKPAKPTLSKAAGTYTGTQNVTITNLTPNATAMYYTYEGEEPANPNAQEFPAGGVDISSSKTLAVYYRASYETETSMEYLYGETTKVEYIILTDPELTYKQGETSVTTATWTIDGTNNTALPVLQNTHNVAVTYESNNTAVATVANDGTVTVVGIGTATITATAAATDVSAADEAYYTLTVNRQMNVSFDATNEWATYYGTENLATPAGLKAYQVTEVNGSTVTTAEIGYIPANTAVLLQNVEGKTAAANTIASAYTGATSTFPNNLLIGSTEAVGVSSINGGTVYVLYNDMFKRATSGTIPANRAYLIVSGAAPARLNIVHGGDDTGIDNIHMDETNDNWYTIDGRKLNGEPQRAGFYIRNGKKVYKR